LIEYKNKKSKEKQQKQMQLQVQIKKILIEYHKQEIKEKTTIANGRATKNIDWALTKTNQEKTTSPTTWR
jgi:hypothetical protein